MNCREARRLNAEGVDDPATLGAMMEHLETCPACLDELGELPPVLLAPPLVHPPPYLVHSIIAQLPATPAIAAARERSAQRRRWIMSGIGVALVALLVLFGTIGLLVDSSWPAQMMGGVQSAIGRGVLALTLVGKAIIATVGIAGIGVVLLVLVLTLISGLAWRRLLVPPQAIRVEVEL